MKSPKRRKPKKEIIKADIPLCLYLVIIGGVMYLLATVNGWIAFFFLWCSMYVLQYIIDNVMRNEKS